jgi:transcription antitermination factor NusG
LRRYNSRGWQITHQGDLLQTAWMQLLSEKWEIGLLNNDGGASPETDTDGQMTAATNRRKWFAAYTRSRHEKGIAEQCDRIGIEHFLPLYTLRNTWKNRVRVDVRLPLFPNYIFVHLSREEQVHLWKLAGVLSLVGTTAGSVAIQDEEMDILRQVVRCKTVAPHAAVHIGDAVCIKRGPLEGLIGTVLRSNNGWRFVVTIDPIGKRVAVDVDGSDLEVLGTQPPFVAAC